MALRERQEEVEHKNMAGMMNLDRDYKYRDANMHIHTLANCNKLLARRRKHKSDLATLPGNGL